MRGDRPLAVLHGRLLAEFTPHARGSTSGCTSCTPDQQVYPACAGIDLALVVFKYLWRRLPRMRGDRPYNWDVDVVVKEFTPHARGSTSENRHGLFWPRVYPACAGIDPHPGPGCSLLPCLPRMRGDRPFDWFPRLDPVRFTPHARGSTPFTYFFVNDIIVYPACAGIDRCMNIA